MARLTKKVKIDMNRTFTDIINSDKPALVDFYAEWCGPCKTMKPILEQLKNKIADDVTIIKIDVDKNPKVANHFGIQSVPTLMIFKKGEIKWRQAGVVSASNLELLIKQNQ